MIDGTRKPVFSAANRLIGGLGLLSLLSACAVGPDYRPRSSSDLKITERFNASSAGTAMDEAALARWWASFDDPVLTRLVERSLAANLDVDAAGARLRRARASLIQARGAGLPSAGASGSAGRSVGQDGGDNTLFQAGFDAAWEADLFGGIRRSVEAARADAESAEANLRFTQLTIASEVALSYLDARLAQTCLDIARKNLAAQDETLEIVGWRVQAGLVSSLDLEQARQLRATTAATIPSLEAGYTAAANRIAVLLGEAPGLVEPLLARAMPVPLPPQVPAAGVPAEVIQRRPDVRAAERSLAAETARIGVATAELYPALRLSGSFGGSATALGDVPSAMIGNLVSGITAPIFQGGQIRARIEGQRAATDASLAAYRQTVLTALEDVENALASLDAAERREREIAIAEEASRNAVLYARSQYRAGLIDFQSLLDSERSLLSSQDSRASVRADRAAAIVQFYKAVGGGWQAAPVPQSALSSTTRQE